MRAPPLCSLLVLGGCVASPTTKDGASPHDSGDSAHQPSDDSAPGDSAPADTAAPNPALTDLAPGNVRDLGPYTCVDIAGAYQPCDHVSDYSGFVYDADDHRMLMFGGGHAASITTDVPELDLAADPLVWAPAYPSTPYEAMTLDNLDQVATSWRSTGHPLARHTIDMMAYSPQARRLVMLPATNSFVLYTQGYPADFPGDLNTGGDVFEYDPVARTWSSYPAAAGISLGYGASAYDPPSGDVIALGRTGLYRYQPASHTLEQVQDAQALPFAYLQNLTYAESTDTHYYLRSDGVVLSLVYDRVTPSASVITQVDVHGTPPTPASDVETIPDDSETGWAYDSARGRICGALTSGTMYCFDPASSTFTAHALTAEGDALPLDSIVFHTIQYDPVDDVFVFLTRGPDGYTRHTAAWRPD